MKVITQLEMIRIKWLFYIWGRTFSALFTSRKKDPIPNNSQKELPSSSLLNKIDELKKQEERMSVLTAQLEEPLEQLSVLVQLNC